MSTLAAARKQKRRPTPAPPPPSPKILHLPRGHRRRQHGTADGFPVVLLDSSSSHSRGGRRERVDDQNWRFEEDVQRDRATLRSPLRVLGKKKNYEERTRNRILGLEDLEAKQEELPSANATSTGSETTKYNNFNKEAFILQRRLEKLGKVSQEKCVRETREMAQANFTLESKHAMENGSSVSAQNNNSKHFDVEVLRQKMEGISKGMYERMEEEYGALLLSNTHTPHASASSSKRFEFPGDSSQATKPPHQELGVRKCSGQCKTVVRKIMEQVREESKQWSEMQDMLKQVRQEMDQLKASRDFWQRRALDSDYQFESLLSTVQEWKTKALAFRTKAKELKREVFALTRELDNSRECRNGEKTRIEVDSRIISLGAQIAKEKRDRVFRLKEKENYHPSNKEIEQEIVNNDVRRKSQILDDLVGSRRLPFQNIGNANAPKTRQNGKAFSSFV